MLLITLVGCMAPTSVTTPFGNDLFAVNTISASRVSSTPPLLSATQTPSVTATLTPTQITTPAPIVQPTAIETSVTIPTPPNDKMISEQVLWLFETNNGCQLPCWWGITPGQTEWTIAETFLNRFDSYIKNPLATDPAYYEPLIPLPTDVFLIDHTQPGILVRNGIVERIDVSIPIGDISPDFLAYYMLSEFLTTYGQPTEIWLATYPGPFDNNELPFRVVLFYREQGITTLYDDNGIKQGNVVNGCPQQYPARVLSLWAASLDLTFEETIRYLAAFNYEYLSLEESTEMDVATFYQTFKNPDNTTCLEIPADLWH